MIKSSGVYMRIIYGGAFNPPTKAHYEIAKYVIEQFPGCEFIFMPAGNVYNKQGLEKDNKRLEMLLLVCKKLDNKATISTFEFEQEKFCGTYCTMEQFQGAYFLMGADNLAEIEKWIKYPDVVYQNQFIIMPREDYDIEAIIESNEVLKKTRNHFIILNEFDKIYISSTAYRLSKDDSLLLEEVADYIKANQLYQEEN
jgi:nicotinate-nucleotide adenylyltransferase